MFFLFFFFSPFPTPHLPSPQTLEGKTNKTNKSKFHTSCSTVFSSNGHTPIGPRFVYPCTNEQIMNEQGWKWSLIESEPSVLLLFFIFFFFCSGFWQPQPRCSEFPTGKLSVPPAPPPNLPLLLQPSYLFIFLTGGRFRTNSGAIQYLYVSFCLVSTAKGGGHSCVWFASAVIRSQLLERRGPFEQSHLFEWAVLLSDKLDPSASLMCPSGDGGSLFSGACLVER